jgi:hypothetical protein
MNLKLRIGLILFAVLTLGGFGFERYFRWQSFVNHSFSLLAIHSERHWKQHRRLPESYSELLGSMPDQTREVFERSESRGFEMSIDRQGDSVAVISAKDKLLPFLSHTYRVECAGEDCNIGSR